MTEPSLRELQSLFAICVSTMILRLAQELHIDVTYGEAYRTAEQAAIYAKEGKGIVNSLHCQRLAIDLNVFIDGQLATTKAQYEIAGQMWKTLNPLARWGGDFINADCDHFSFEYQGRA